MTSSCRDNARRHLRRFSGADGTLLLWECFIGECPHLDLVADALDYLARFHEHHRQHLVEAAYREEAIALRKQIEEDPVARATTIEGSG
jgi:hypothetical protein